MKSNRPLAVVEDDKLVEAFEIADDKIKVPSRRMIRADIEDAFKKKRLKQWRSLVRLSFSQVLMMLAPHLEVNHSWILMFII